MELGSANAYIGNVKNAIHYQEQALSIAHEITDRANESSLLINLGNRYGELGDTHKAITYQERALIIARDIGNRENEGNALGNLGIYYEIIDDIHKAIEFDEHALVIKREMGDRRVESILLENIGYSYSRLERYQKAKENYKEAIQIADEISFAGEQLNARWGLAQAYLFQNDLVNACAAIEAALQYDVPQYNHNATALHGIIALRQGERETAQEAFSKSIAQADEILVKTPDYYSALDAKGLALCGSAVSREWRVENSKERDELVAEAMEIFRKARKIAPHAGVVKSVLRLFDELVKCDGEGILKDVREVIAG